MVKICVSLLRPCLTLQKVIKRPQNVLKHRKTHFLSKPQRPPVPLKISPLAPGLSERPALSGKFCTMFFARFRCNWSYGYPIETFLVAFES